MGEVYRARDVRLKRDAQLLIILRTRVRFLRTTRVNVAGRGAAAAQWHDVAVSEEQARWRDATTSGHWQSEVLMR